MTKLTVKYLSIVLAIYLVSLVVDGVYIRSVAAVLAMGFMLLLVNLVLKPLLLLITLPFNLLTFGLFSLVVNAVTILIADGFVRGVDMGGFWHAMLVALVIVIVNNLLLDWNKPGYRGKNE